MATPGAGWRMKSVSVYLYAATAIDLNIGTINVQQLNHGLKDQQTVECENQLHPTKAFQPF